MCVFLQRLLETLAGEDEGEMAIMREKSPQNALVPITQASLLSASHSQDIDKGVYVIS